MKRFILSLVASSFAFLVTVGQTITVPEPEFLYGYIYLTSDSTYTKMPKEHGSFKKHESKMSKFAKIGGAIADVAGSAGIAAIGMGGISSGIKTATTAAAVSSAAGSLDLLGGYEGMDIVFEGPKSPFVIKSGEPVRIIFKEESNDIDPLDLVRVVKFKNSKKERRIQWMNISSSLLGMEKAEKNGYLKFDGCKYGDSSYLLTIPAEELDKGEYGIIMGSGAEATVIPIVTFSVE